MARKAFDLIGDIGIIEAENKKEEKRLVKKITETYPRVKAIFKKESETRGRHRTRKYKTVFRSPKKVKESGMKASETIHTEFGCRYRLDVKKVFFSPREATNRDIVSNLVEPGERVLVMFSGVGPYAVLIAKRKQCKVTAIEINPTAVKYAKENVKMNKVQDNVRLIKGDVRKVKVRGKFSRVIMPLGTESWKFLRTAFKSCAKGGVIHVYGLGEKKDLYSELEERISKAARKAGKRIEFLDRRVVLPYSPAFSKVEIDFRVL